MRTYTSRKDTFKYGFMAMVMTAVLAADLVLFSNGVILSMVTVGIPFVACTAGLLYSLMRMGVMEFTTGSYCEQVNYDMKRKAARKYARSTYGRRSSSRTYGSRASHTPAYASGHGMAA